MRRKYSAQYKKIDKICLLVIGLLFFAFIIVNLFGMIFQRDERSEREKRELAKFPEFSFSSLFDGSFTSGLTAFFSDHLVFRDGMIDLSKKFDSMYGVNYALGDSSIVIIDGGQGSEDDKDDEFGCVAHGKPPLSLE